MPRAEEKLNCTVRKVIATIRELPPDTMTTIEISVVETLENALAECFPEPQLSDTSVDSQSASLMVSGIETRLGTSKLSLPVSR